MPHDHGQATRKLPDSLSLSVKWAESQVVGISPYILHAAPSLGPLVPSHLVLG